MCEDIKKFVSEMSKQKFHAVKFSNKVAKLVQLTLPGGGKLEYINHIASPKAMKPAAKIVKKKTLKKRVRKNKIIQHSHQSKHQSFEEFPVSIKWFWSLRDIE